MASKPGSSGDGKREVTFKIGYDRKQDVTAYLYSANGELIDAKPLKAGQASFSVEGGMLRRARLLFGPPFPEQRGKATISSLERLNAYEPSWRYEPSRDIFDLGIIPDFHLNWWPWCFCVVRGQVVKPPTGPLGVVLPVCNARVHICEVDRFPWIILKLPDPDLYRLRDELLEKLRYPIPFPDPDPGPLLPDLGIIDPLPVAGALGVLGRLDAVALNPQPLPPKEIQAYALRQQSAPLFEQLEPQFKSALLSRSPTVLREALSANYKLILPWLCHWPWIWPWFYTCDELAVVMTDEHGRFETTIWYPCFGDHPDLYFSVEYSIGGSWTFVYRPSIACHTWWNFVCGSSVTITVADPRVPGCIDGVVPPGKVVVVKTIGRNISMGEILGVAAGANEGLFNPAFYGAGKPSPFAGTLEPRVDFGSGITPAVATHYRWSYRKLPSSSEADWKVLEAPVWRHYRETTPPGDPVVYKSAMVGPDPAVTGQFFKIKPDLPAGGEEFENLDERYDLASAYAPTALWPLAEAGRHEFKLELFKPGAGGVMTRVDLTAAGVDLWEITDPAPLTAGTYVTTAPGLDRILTVPGVPGPHLVGYRLVLHIDNRRCSGTILEEMLTGGVGAGRCGFLEYDAGDAVTLSFRAAHPRNFAWFAFGTVRVSTGLASASAAAYVDVAAANGFNRSGDTFSKAVAVTTLLTEDEIVPPGETSCTRAAFAESLHVYALASDGYGRMSNLDAPAAPGEVAIRAFAITPA